MSNDLTTKDPDHAEAAPSPDAFRFGRNWQRYVDTHLDADRERIAAESLYELAGDLRGRSFLDIGCGSGLFSLCAYRAGADTVVSLDVDPDSVEATRSLHRAVGSPENWQVIHRSILDTGLVTELEQADVVYSWGVLHHTGDMQTAIRHAAELVRPGGRLVIAIYNRVENGLLSSRRWWYIKRTYNHVPRFVQRVMEALYLTYWLQGTLRSRRNPVREAREYRQSRGMAISTDLVDWLGGFPYEYASAPEIVQLCEGALGLRCARIIPMPAGGTGNNQFVFERPTD